MASKPETLPAGSKDLPVRPAEKQLAPGIYFTPAPSAAAAAPAETSPDGLPTPPNVDGMTRAELETEYRMISKSVEKLLESNMLMTEFDPDGKDAELAEAVRENTGIVVRKKIRMVEVKGRLAYLMRSQPHVRPTQSNGNGSAGGGGGGNAAGQGGLHL